MASDVHKEKLKEMCEGWKPESAESFAEIVRRSLEVLGEGLDVERELAGEFDVAISTIERWSEGTSAPLPLVQEHVVSVIQKKVEDRKTGNEG